MKKVLTAAFVLVPAAAFADGGSGGEVDPLAALLFLLGLAVFGLVIAFLIGREKKEEK